MDFTHTARAAAVAALMASTGPAAWAQFTVPTGASMNAPPGSSINLACVRLDVSGSLDLAASTLNDAGGVLIQSGGGLNGGASTLHVSGNWSNAGTFAAGGGSVIFDDSCATGPITLSGHTVFNNLTLRSSSGRTFVLPQGSNIIVNGTLTLQGAPGNPITLQSSGGGTAVVNLGPGAQVVQSNATVGGTVQIGPVPPAPPSTPASIPTLSQWGLALLSLLAAALGLRGARRRQA